MSAVMNTVVQDGSKRSPLEAPLATIIANPQYLSREHAMKLLGLIKLNFPDLQEADETTQRITLRQQLQKMGTQIEKMTTNAIGGESTDLKRVFDAQKEFFKLFAKYNDTLKANDRLQAVENATIEAFKDLADKSIGEKFLELFHVKLEQSSKNMVD